MTVSFQNYFNGTHVPIKTTSNKLPYATSDQVVFFTTEKLVYEALYCSLEKQFIKGRHTIM
jgi:hypothetical protein